MNDRVLIESRRFRATPDRIFAAWTDPNVMAKWFFSGTGWTANVESDPRVGGLYKVEMVTPAGEVLAQHGEWKELVPYSRISFTWNNDLVQDTLVTIELSASEEGTHMTLTHLLPAVDQILTLHREGWIGCLANLEALYGAGGS